MITGLPVLLDLIFKEDHSAGIRLVADHGQSSANRGRGEKRDPTSRKDRDNGRFDGIDKAPGEDLRKELAASVEPDIAA
jgi:hypothetical protein